MEKGEGKEPKPFPSGKKKRGRNVASMQPDDREKKTATLKEKREVH